MERGSGLTIIPSCPYQVVAFSGQKWGSMCPSDHCQGMHRKNSSADIHNEAPCVGGGTELRDKGQQMVIVSKSMA